MDRHDFRRLTDFDFEQVTKDILESVLGVRLEIFAAGADGGIDLRHFKANGETLVAQCKHWQNSGRPALLRHMRNSELPKIRKLAPERYILATSVDFTVSSKELLMAHLEPYVKTPEDLLGVGELEAELSKRPEIVKRHIRLWLSSAQVLDALLSKEILLRSGQLADDIRETIKSFAPSAAVDDARTMLDSHGVCIIAGVPGVGKTTLAQFLAAQYIADGYELYELSGDVSEGLKVWNDDRPQVFYYDDFLGQTTLRDITSSNQDSRILKFAKRVSGSGNKKFILTTREYILAQARQRSERLADSYVDIAKFLLDVGELDPRARAEILYNHIYFSDLPAENRAAFAELSNYRPIINHRNFNPRLIAMCFEGLPHGTESPEESVARVRRNLDQPMSLWQHMFDFQLVEPEIALVEAMFLADGPVALEDLHAKWVAYSRGDEANSPTQFRRALGALEGTLLRIESGQSQGGTGPRVALHNPSVRDFMRIRFASSPEILSSALERLTEMEQLTTLWDVSRGYGGDALFRELRNKRALVERVASRLATSPAPDDIDTGWARGVATLIDMSAELSSAALQDAATARLGGDWPDYFSEPDRVVALVRALRQSQSQVPGWREHADELTERLAEEVTDGLWDFDSLIWSREILSSLEGPTAEAALQSIESSLVERAIEAVEEFRESGELPLGRDTAEQVISVLSAYLEPEDLAPGFSAFVDQVEVERAKEQGGGQVSALHQRVTEGAIGASVHDVMSMLLK